MKAEEPEAACPARAPAPPGVVVLVTDLARQSFERFRFRHPEVQVRYEGDDRPVTGHSRESGVTRGLWPAVHQPANT